MIYASECAFIFMCVCVYIKQRIPRTHNTNTHTHTHTNVSRGTIVRRRNRYCYSCARIVRVGKYCARSGMQRNVTTWLLRRTISQTPNGIHSIYKWTTHTQTHIYTRTDVQNPTRQHCSICTRCGAVLYVFVAVTLSIGRSLGGGGDGGGGMRYF